MIYPLLNVSRLVITVAFFVLILHEVTVYLVYMQVLFLPEQVQPNFQGSGLAKDQLHSQDFTFVREMVDEWARSCWETK